MKYPLIFIAILMTSALACTIWIPLEPEKPKYEISELDAPHAKLGFVGCVERCHQRCLDERKPAAKCKCGWCNVFRTEKERGKSFDEYGNPLPD
jgi:hypothetical protein